MDFDFFSWVDEGGRWWWSAAGEGGRWWSAAGLGGRWWRQVMASGGSATFEDAAAPPLLATSHEPVVLPSRRPWPHSVMLNVTFSFDVAEMDFKSQSSQRHSSVHDRCCSFEDSLPFDCCGDLL
ncbi:uncharacterized protein LOC110868321 [Helianthus annuus]|uniref:uncharacterized protein LOC110868321 n=1 Tax=Helianthus annuus TaxID=4232 RepID=UPI001652BAC7|nr:uncharacterized protein LOC110868321 [Helianthus annuus]